MASRDSIDEKDLKALVLVCAKCGKKDSCPRVEGRSASKALRDAWRESLRAEFGKRGARVVMSSCLDLCPKNKIAVGIVRPGVTGLRIVAVDPNATNVRPVDIACINVTLMK